MDAILAKDSEDDTEDHEDRQSIATSEIKEEPADGTDLIVDYEEPVR